jgi:hypothetical protein
MGCVSLICATRVPFGAGHLPAKLGPEAAAGIPRAVARGALDLAELSTHARLQRASDRCGKLTAHLLSTLVEVLRDLFRPRRPQVEPAEVVPFSAERAAHADKEVDGDRSKAA